MSSFHRVRSAHQHSTYLAPIVERAVGAHSAPYIFCEGISQ